MDSEREGQTATLLGDGEILIAGGSDLSGSLSTAELYDPKTGTFRSTGDMTTPRQGATATLLADGRVLIVGGYVGGYGSTTWLSSAEVYDPGTGQFQADGLDDHAPHARLVHRHSPPGWTGPGCWWAVGRHGDARDGGAVRPEDGDVQPREVRWLPPAAPIRRRCSTTDAS